ncbi:hypothetical protein BDN71DRAFT_1452392 [Pleurotus eryngii]|uniref:Uncharacterized protein n=1 Tax=Pleurotus eryngii TaxID=5323 RepID=A0A9P5ZP07_PLEER|nr:hypothetical protein BDN71DRAFT_1452392 [Pleurotus eryngii]
MGSGLDLGLCVCWMIGPSGNGGQKSIKREQRITHLPPTSPRHSIVPSPHLPLISTFEPPEVIHNAGVCA